MKFVHCLVGKYTLQLDISIIIFFTHISTVFGSKIHLTRLRFSEMQKKVNVVFTSLYLMFSKYDAKLDMNYTNAVCIKKKYKGQGEFCLKSSSPLKSHCSSAQCISGYWINNWSVVIIYLLYISAQKLTYLHTIPVIEEFKFILNNKANMNSFSSSFHLKV